jgi:ABC-2 type transport system ATP-binding protein
MLQIRDLVVRYPGDLTAIDRLSLTLSNGLTGLLGPNGAGKSTLMRTLATLQAADSGQVEWTLDDGRTLQLGIDDADWRARLGYLPQDFGLYPTLTVRETVDHFASLKGFADAAARRHEVAQQLAHVRLEAVANRAVGALSGGMRQRVGIAIALLGAPALLIVDEPTAGLDPDERAALLHILASLAKRAIVIVSTHLVDDVESLCDRVTLLHRGRLQVDAHPDDAVAPLAGRVWQFAPSEVDLERWRASPALLRERLRGGKPFVRVLAERQPVPHALAVSPTLDDLFSLTVRNSASPLAE